MGSMARRNMLSRFFLQFTLLCGLTAFAQPPPQLGYIPLAVKTPYLHGWVASNNGSARAPAHIWSNFFTTDRILGWCGIIRVDDKVYQWLGDAIGFDFVDFTNTLASEVTPTKSVFRLQAGPIQFNATFFTPIETADYVRQSMPFSYMFVDGFSANDSLAHNIQIYSDISAEWVSRDDTAVIDGNTSADNPAAVYHSLKRENMLPMQEDQNMAEDSTGYYALALQPGFNVTWQTGIDTDCRGLFATSGGLDQGRDINSRPVNQSWPVFAFSVGLGSVSPGSQPPPVVFALGIVRESLVAYQTESSVQTRTGYYWSTYSTIGDVISNFLKDFSEARARSSALDDKILSAASAVSPEYAGILSLVTRQIFAAMDITIPSESLNASDVKIFMKDIGVSLRANPVEVIYGAFPALLYLNSTFAKDLLVPLLDFQSSSLYKNPYASPDLGVSYPNITGNTNDNDTFAVESCGNMLIMTYAHAVKSGDGSLLSQYYTKLKSWADFLVNDFTSPGGLSNTGGMSNLAIKGILGIYSMAMINQAVNISDTTYMTHAMKLIADWGQSVVTDSHISAVFNQPDSWGLMYNLFPAIWLNTGLIEERTLGLQAEFYANQTDPNFGFSLDTSQDVAYPHWTTMTAATIPGNLSAVRNELIKPVYQQAYTATNVFPLPVKYNPSTGDHLSGSGSGSAIHGAAFGILALGLQNVDITAGPVNFGSGMTSPGAIVGGVVGGLALLLILLGGIFFWYKRRQKKAVNASTEEFSRPHPFTVSQWTDWNRLLHPRDHNSGAAVMTSKSSRADPPAAASPAPTAMPSRKQRDARSSPVHTENPTTNTTVASTSASGTEDLRAEMEELRREMASIRQIAEPPPGYD